MFKSRWDPGEHRRSKKRNKLENLFNWPKLIDTTPEELGRMRGEVIYNCTFMHVLEALQQVAGASLALFSGLLGTRWAP